MTLTIDRFEDEYAFLSNFLVYPLWISEKEFKSGEHAFQYFKMALPTDQERVFYAQTPGDAKKIARRGNMRRDWEQIKIGVMFDVITAKFKEQHLKKMLLDTEDAILIEGNWWGDEFWGVCKGSGANWLGRILMIVRSRLEATR